MLTTIILSSTSVLSVGALIFLLIAYIQLNKKLSTTRDIVDQMNTVYNTLTVNYKDQEKVIQTLIKENAFYLSKIDQEITLRKKAEVERDANFKKWTTEVDALTLTKHFTELLKKLSTTENSTSTPTSNNQ